jgi:NADH-quinone oxidoreductase subunit N
MHTDTLGLLSAEIVLLLTAVSIYLAGAFFSAPKLWSWLSGGGLALAAAALWRFGGAADPGGPVAADPLALYGRWLALAAGGVLLLLNGRPLAQGGTAEYLGTLLLAIAGLMLSAGAADLVLLFVSLELISIPTYILLYLGRRDAAGQEASAKYFFLSVLASAMLLYGFSFLYGTAGSTQLSAIRQAMENPAAMGAAFGPLVKVALVLIFAGLSFRVVAVPFHFYAPDVYQGTSHPNAALLSVLPKAAGLLVLARLLLVAMPGAESYAWRIALVLAVLTMTVGNALALWQDHLRRLLAYSSIANAGFMLIGLAAGLATATAKTATTTAATTVSASGAWDGVAAMLFYLVVYAAATLGTFAALIYLGGEGQQVEAVEELAGLGRTRPVVAGTIALFMFSLAGLPPLAGLWGKLLLFFSALDVQAGTGGSLRPWFVSLAVIGVLNAVVAAVYYLRIVAVMYFRAPLATPKARGGPAAWLAAVVCAAAVLALGVYPPPLMRASRGASPTAGAKPQACVTRGAKPQASAARSTAAFSNPQSLSLNPFCRRPAMLGCRYGKAATDPCHAVGTNVGPARPAGLRAGR